MYTVIRTKGRVGVHAFMLDVVVKEDQAIRCLKTLKVAGIESTLHFIESKQKLCPMNFIDAFNQVYKAFGE